MASASTSSKKDPVTVEEIQDIGRKLISLPSSHVEQLHLLDRVENVLRRVEQSSPQPVIEALKPITKALVADVLLKNDVRDVKISVASCISQIMRITAPDSPYSDEELKIYFQVSVSAFEELLSLSYPQFPKAVSILESFAKFRTCIMMLDLELDTEIIKMFRNLFHSVGSNLMPNVLFYMERTMTLVIEDSDELSDEIIMLLLDNLKLENQKAQPLAWELGVEILKNCGTTLKKYIPVAVELMNLDLNDFAEIVASICQDVSGKKNSEVKDVAPEATKCEKASGSTTVTKNSTDPNGKRDDAAKGKKSSKKRKSITQSKQQSSSQKVDTSNGNEDEQPGKKIDCSKENEDNQPITVAKPEKRTRKPNSLLKPDEGYWTPQLKRRSKKKLDPVNFSEGLEKVTGTISEKYRKKSKSRLHGEASKVKRKSISTELNEDEATKQTPGIKVCGPKLVGRKIKVWWPEDGVFYPGKIVSFNRASDKYEVLYQDGEMEMVDLNKENWELLKDEEERISGSEAAPVDTLRCDLVEVRGYMVKASIADTLKGIFNKYGDIASNCPYKSASVKASLLEIVCTMLQKLQNDDSPPDFNEVQSVINDADKAKLEIGWLREEFEKKKVANEDGQKAKMLRGTKRQVLHAVKAAKTELKHRRAELAVAQNQVEEAERCFSALRCVLTKVKDDILELEESRKKRSKMV